MFPFLNEKRIPKVNTWTSYIISLPISSLFYLLPIKLHPFFGDCFANLVSKSKFIFLSHKMSMHMFLLLPLLHTFAGLRFVIGYPVKMMQHAMNTSYFYPSNLWRIENCIMKIITASSSIRGVLIMKTRKHG